MLAGLPTPKTTDDDNFDNVEDTMRKIINGSRYSTDTAKKIAHWESDQDYTSFTHCEETLYRTKAGKWFIHGTGNAATVYAVRRGDGWTAPGEQSRAALRRGRANLGARAPWRGTSATPSLAPEVRTQRMCRLRSTSRVRSQKRWQLG